MKKNDGMHVLIKTKEKTTPIQNDSDPLQQAAKKNGLPLYGHSSTTIMISKGADPKLLEMLEETKQKQLTSDTLSQRFSSAKDPFQIIAMLEMMPQVQALNKMQNNQTIEKKKNIKIKPQNNTSPWPPKEKIESSSVEIREDSEDEEINVTTKTVGVNLPASSLGVFAPSIAEHNAKIFKKDPNLHLLLKNYYLPAYNNVRDFLKEEMTHFVEKIKHPHTKACYEWAINNLDNFQGAEIDNLDVLYNKANNNSDNNNVLKIQS